VLEVKTKLILIKSPRLAHDIIKWECDEIRDDKQRSDIVTRVSEENSMSGPKLIYDPPLTLTG
jgi:hypothetical protein